MVFTVLFHTEAAGDTYLEQWLVLHPQTVEQSLPQLEQLITGEAPCTQHTDVMFQLSGPVASRHSGHTLDRDRPLIQYSSLPFLHTCAPSVQQHHAQRLGAGALCHSLCIIVTVAVTMPFLALTN